jgi:hypothetical protein
MLKIVWNFLCAGGVYRWYRKTAADVGTPTAAAVYTERFAP